MLNLRYTDKVDFQGYEEEINASGTCILIDENKYYNRIDSLIPLFETCKIELSDLMAILSNGKITNPTPAKMVSLLLDYCNVDRKSIEIYRQGSYKTSASEEAIGNLIANLENLEKIGKASYL